MENATQCAMVTGQLGLLLEFWRERSTIQPEGLILSHWAVSRFFPLDLALGTSMGPMVLIGLFNVNISGVLSE
jgi:hypothetical protein